MEIFGTEFAYGGHPFPFTGVFEITPRNHDELGEQFHFRQSIQIGCTDFNYQEVRRIVEELGNQFRGDRYHLMNNNCNHFSSALTQVSSSSISLPLSPSDDDIYNNSIFLFLDNLRPRNTQLGESFSTFQFLCAISTKMFAKVIISLCILIIEDIKNCFLEFVFFFVGSGSLQMPYNTVSPPFRNVMRPIIVHRFEIAFVLAAVNRHSNRPESLSHIYIYILYGHKKVFVMCAGGHTHTYTL